MADLGTSKVYGDLTVLKNLTVKLDVNFGGVISGDGSGLTNLNADAVTTGDITPRISWVTTSVEQYGTFYGMGGGSDFVVAAGEALSHYTTQFPAGSRDTEKLWLIADSSVNIKAGIAGSWGTGYDLTFGSNGIISGTFTIDYGLLPITAAQVSNWDDAYSWGNHAAAGYQVLATPNPPTINSTTVVNESIEVTFSASPSADVTAYEVWSDGGIGSFDLIGVIPTSDIQPTMSVVDASFQIGGTINYRVHAVRGGVYSTAATTAVTFTEPTLDVANLDVFAGNTEVYISYVLPVSRFLSHVEIYADDDAIEANLSRTGATLIYSGTSSNFIYKVPEVSKDNFFKFWVECVNG